MAKIEVGYGQLNQHLSAQKNGQIYSQILCKIY